jgi:hypothetical protein
MEITTRALWATIHGMGFGALYLLACSGALVELYRRYAPGPAQSSMAGEERFLQVYLVLMAVLAWLAVITGTYILYPWYRAVAPAGTANLAAFPQQFLKSNPATIGWHSLGMEWKEHVAWLTPISTTMAAAVFLRYGREIRNHPQLRSALLCFVAVSFLAAAVAGFFGAMINKHAPLEGGPTLRAMRGDSR